MPVAYFSSDEETMSSSQATADNFAHDRKQEAEANHTEKDRKRKAAEAFNKKSFNKAVIDDTHKTCKKLKVLFGKPPDASIYMLPAHQDRACETRPRTQPVPVQIYAGDCVALARSLAQNGEKVWLLNMASSSKPGGGVWKGSNAQEEHLCRCSNLLPQLEASKNHYPLKKEQYYGTDYKVIVTKHVTFFKNPNDYNELEAKDWFRVGVVTAAAENMEPQAAGFQAERRAHRNFNKCGPNAQRFIDYVLDVVQMQGPECTHIVLSAWGCGAFRQSAEAVAKCFKQGLARFDRWSFPKVTFAIIDDHNSPPPGNLSAFQSVFPDSASASVDSTRYFPESTRSR